MDEETTVVAARVGRTIKALRAEKGWSQATLASMIGFTPPGLWKIEAGRSDFRLSTLALIARVLETPLERVVGGFESSPDIRAFFEALGGLAAHEREMREISKFLVNMFPPKDSNEPRVGGQEPVALGM